MEVRFTSLQLKVMSVQKLSLHFQHTWIFAIWCEDQGLMKTIYPQSRTLLAGSTSIERCFKSMEWLNTFHCHVNTPWFTTLRVLPCLEHQMGCVHQLPRHTTFLRPKSHGEDPVVSVHSLKFSSQTNVSRSSPLVGRTSLVGGCFLATHMQKFDENYQGYQHQLLRTFRQVTQ